MAKTKPDKLLSLFEDLAEKMNINIVQGKGDFQGGMCSVNSESYIVLNKLKPIDQRLGVLVREFSKLNLKPVKDLISTGSVFDLLANFSIFFNKL